MTAATGAWAQDAKHLITATYDKQTRSLEQPLPYATTVGALYEAVTGQPFSYLISQLSAYELNLTGITSLNTDVVSIGEFNGASTPVTVKADGEATVRLNFGNYAQGIFVSVVPPLYVTMADGTKDAAKWTATVGTNSTAQALPVGELSEKDAVTLKYNGRLKVKAVNATHDGWNGDLSNIPASLIQDDGRTVIVPDGTTLTGTLNGSSQPYKITIAAGATVTLDNATINGVSNTSYKWAGLNCLGNATIVLKDGTTNTVRGFWMIYPGIHVPEGSTLTITGGKEGNGKLIASSNGYGAGIGGGFDASSDGICGNITITGGDITATGGDFCAGIGGGCNQPCGNISIEGGSVTATGGTGAAGIGGGINCSCGNITITNGVTRVTATNGGAASYSIGAGNPGTCGTVTIGGVVYWEDNAAVGDGATYLAQATFEFVNLAKLSDNYTANHGNVLTGTTTYNVDIAAGATVTLAGVDISGDSYCIKCKGDATIVLKDGTTNTLTSTSTQYPALWAGDAGTTLTIKGSTGELNVTSGESRAGIGGGFKNTDKTCGNITIDGGVITAQGGDGAPGIGCDNQNKAVCGNITITNGVTKVTAMGGSGATYSIGKGNKGSCGTIIIGGTKFWENNVAVDNAADYYLKQSSIIYEP